MKLSEILARYDAAALEALAADKIDDVLHLRLPKEVLIDEIADTIASFSYVSDVIASRHPPCFEILDLLINAEDHMIEVANLRAMVRERTTELIHIADGDDSLGLSKEYDLYTRMLEAAWANDTVVDASESSMLTALRRELGITFREHIVLEHGERVRHFWNTPDAYERERNHLIRSGLLHSIDDRYVLPEELPPLVRKVWSIQLPQDDFRRLLAYLSNERLYDLLSSYGLKVSGTKEEKINRLVNNYVEPPDLLDRLTIYELKDIARNIGAHISGSKSEITERLIEFFRNQEDLRIEEATAEPEYIEPEPKALEWDSFQHLFQYLTIENLYEIADSLDGIPKSGSKSDRISFLWQSRYSEVTLLGVLTNTVLRRIMGKLYLPTSGPKDEKIARLIDWAKAQSGVQAESVEADVDDGFIGSDHEFFEDAEQEPVVSHEPGKPRALDAIASSYPFLNLSQQVVLAVLHELHSLNETELERLVARYNIDWFLLKAEMMNLVELLEEHGAPVVQIRARGDYNVYEYVGS